MASHYANIHELSREQRTVFYLDGLTPIKKWAVIHSLSPILKFEILKDPRATMNELDAFSDEMRSCKLSDLKYELIKKDLLYIYLNKSDRSRLEIRDPHLISIVIPSKKSYEVDIYRNTTIKIVFAVFIVASILFGVWSSVPHFAKYVAHKISFEQEKKARIYIEPLLAEEVCKSPLAHEQNAILNALAQKLLTENSIDMPVDVMYGSKNIVNAIALPSGVIIVYPGIIEKMQKKPIHEAKEILAGILAHELEHHIQRHIVEVMVRSTLLTFIWSTALGDFSSLAVLDPATLIQLVNLKFSREAESAADNGAAQMLAKSKIAVMPFLNFLEDLSREMSLDKAKYLEFLSNHPLSGRGNRLKQAYSTTITQTEIMSDEEWSKLTMGCR